MRISKAARTGLAATIIAAQLFLTSCNEGNNSLYDTQKTKHRTKTSQKIQTKRIEGDWFEIGKNHGIIHVLNNRITQDNRMRKGIDRGEIHNMFGNVNYTTKRFTRPSLGDEIKVIRWASPDLITYSNGAFVKDTNKITPINSFEEIKGKWVGIGEDMPKRGRREPMWEYEKRVREFGIDKTYLGSKYKEITDTHVYAREQEGIGDARNRFLIKQSFKVGDTYVLLIGGADRAMTITPHGKTAKFLGEWDDGTYERQ